MRYLLALAMLAWAGYAHGQRSVADSLKIIEQWEASARVRATARLVGEHSFDELGEQVGKTLEKAIDVARTAGMLPEMAQMLTTWGTYLSLREGQHYDALLAYEEALGLFDKMGDARQEAVVSRLIGNIHKDRGDLKQALTYYLASLKQTEQLADKAEKARTLGSIGLVYKNQEKYAAAVDYFRQALELLEGMRDAQRDDEAIAITYGNMGVCATKMGQYEDALAFFQKALAIDQYRSDRYGIAFDHFAIAETYHKQGDHQKALRYIGVAVDFFKELEDGASMLACRMLQGQVYHDIGMTSQAVTLLLHAADSAQQMGMKPLVKQAYERLHDIYESQGDVRKAYDYYRRYIAVKDSISSSEISDSIERIKNEYNAEKRAKEIERLRIEAALKQAELDKQKQFRFFSVFGFLLLLLLLGVIYGRYQIKQHANRELERHQKKLEDAAEKTMGSIRYGSRIQQALITASEPLENAFPESFILLRPKDIVTGDFYWYVNRGDEQILAAIDCTGHGVPGAFMTLFGYSLLNRIVINDGVSDPSQILALMGMEVMKLFQTQDESQVIQDGMDMALVKVNQREKRLWFAGANRPMVLHTAEGQQFIKGDRIGLGGTKMMERGKPFEIFEYDYQPGDTFYIFSDGYADQFGGPENKKFMIKNFRELLNGLQMLSMKAQHKKLELVMQEWMGNYPQTDDIIVIGVRL